MSRTLFFSFILKIYLRYTAATSTFARELVQFCEVFFPVDMNSMLRNGNGFD